MDKFTILVADDEENFREIFKDLLSGEKYQVLCAASRQETLQIIRTCEVHVLLLDKRFPTDADGLRTLTEVRQLNPNLEVLLLTAFPDSNSNLQAVQGGVAAYLLKTSDYGMLMQTIDYVIEMLKLKRKNQELIVELKAKNDRMQEAHSALRTWNETLVQRLRRNEEGQNKTFAPEPPTKMGKTEMLALSLVHEINNRLQISQLIMGKMTDTSEVGLADWIKELSGVTGQIEEIAEEYYGLILSHSEESQPLELGCLLKTVVSLARMFCWEKKVTFRQEIPEALPRIQANQRQLFDLLFNLVKNCVEAAEGVDG